jgi:hypothetical protein
VGHIAGLDAVTSKTNYIATGTCTVYIRLCSVIYMSKLMTSISEYV